MDAAGKSRQQSVGGVRVSQIVEDTSPLKPVYDPEHPDADENGYVQMPKCGSDKGNGRQHGLRPGPMKPI